MKTLCFSPATSERAGKRLRAASFAERSNLPVAAACVVANAARDVLASVLASDIEMRLFEPSVPSVAGWAAIARGARTYRIAGARAEAALVLREADALALAAAAFGEFGTTERPLSDLESEALRGAVASLAGAFASLCGPLQQPPASEMTGSIAGFSTYFELQIERPFQARIGVALARDPDPHGAPALRPEQLLDVPVTLVAVTEGVGMMASELGALELGDVVPITVSMGSLEATLTLAGRPLARGECGVRGNRLALALRLGLDPEGSCEPEL